MSKPEITLQEFQRVELRVGTIRDIEPVIGSKKLYKIKINLGDIGDRQTVAALALYYKAEDLKGRKVIFLTNLKPANLAGELSEGMILAAESGGQVSLLTLDKEIPDGAHIL